MTDTIVRKAGRPLDPDLAGRYIDAGIQMIDEVGLQNLTVDRLAARIHAGKAAFYRRWPSVHHFLADVVRRLQVEPVGELTADAVTVSAGRRLRELLAGDAA